MLPEILDATYFENRVLDYLIALGAVIGGIIVLKIIKAIVLRKLRKWAERTETTLDDFIVRTVQKTVVPLLYLGLVYLVSRSLTLNPGVIKGINVAGAILFTLFGVRFVAAVVGNLLRHYWLGKEKDKAREKTIKALIPIVRVIIWVIGIIFLLDNLGFNVSAAVAGLGIGGIAVALAAQAVLGDLFSYFAILLDRPFELGDYIIVGESKGHVEHIGLKTTRIRSLSGEELVFSNTDLTGSRVQNYKRMLKRRVVFGIGVTYETPAEKLESIPETIATIINGIDDAVFDRAHFVSFGDFSLNYEIVYYVSSNDYTKYMDIQQQINLALFKELGQQKIGFAYPTYTVYLPKG